MEVLIYRDQFDDEMFSLATSNNGRTTCWTSVHVDAVLSMFGEDVYQQAKELPPGQILPVCLEVKVLEAA